MTQVHSLGIAAMLLLSTAAGAAPPPACQDTTPHKVQMVPVAPGVNLEVLDWGGSGETMVLLTGLGDNAHVYDDFAYQWTPFFHVIGITRRGSPPSSIPPDGYDVPTRVADDLAVFDALGIDRAIIVGHSLAGSELSGLGETHADRVDKLVYLDAVDLAERDEVTGPPGPDQVDDPADLKSIWAYQAASARNENIRKPIQEVCLTVQFDSNGAIVASSAPSFVRTALLAGVAAVPPVNWAAIAAPRLGIFAQYTLNAKLPWYWYLSSDQQALFDEQFPLVMQWQTDTIQKCGGAGFLDSGIS
jgi:pimeloyl-ACP methyl ester carboxylesterase